MDDAVRHEQQLVFTVAGSDFGIPVLHVKEILQWEGVTPVPGTPPAVAGVASIRGTATPVVDLAVKVGRPSAPAGKRTCILVVEARLGGEPVVMGLKVDAVQAVLDLRPDDVEPPPSFGAGVTLDFLHGLARQGKQFVLLLDVDRVLAATDEQLRAFIAGAADASAAEAA